FDPAGGVAYMAHIGGFVVGLGTGYLWKTLIFQNPVSFQPKRQIFKNRPNMAEMGIGTQPEIIKGPDFYEIIAEVRGLTGISEIKTDYNPDTKIMNIYTPRSNEPEVSVKLPDDASDLKVDQVQYLNGILRIRLVKQI
ncbi:MAG TPA: hypothetical protein VFI64_06790, partial [Nitrososphaeraceae archaeon]|nr:hypothetical protein [Nitrososphaeraceae archaeon]